jgi:copper homeostasis protein
MTSWPNSFKKEACVETYDQALTATRQGANRIELCSDLAHDGLTPDLDLTRQLAEILQIPIRVMIRPRPGNFVFTNTEVEQMINSINQFKQLPIEGFVIGMLTPNSRPDLPNLKRLAQAALPFKMTFHKAIDECTNITEAVFDIINNVPVDTILTSGGQPTAWEGRETLQKLVRITGKRVNIMPAGKITASNIDQLHQQIQAKWYHGRKITR